MKDGTEEQAATAGVIRLACTLCLGDPSAQGLPEQAGLHSTFIKNYKSSRRKFWQQDFTLALES